MGAKNAKTIESQLILWYNVRRSLLSQSCGYRRCALLRTCAIVGFAKMPLQASIFASWYNVCSRLAKQAYTRNGGDNIANERLIAEIGARAKSNSHRIEKLEEIACEIHKQNENIAKMVAQMEFMNKQLSIHDAKLSEIENRPQKRLGSIITAIITAICGALIGGAVTAVLNMI